MKIVELIAQSVVEIHARAQRFDDLGDEPLAGEYAEILQDRVRTALMLNDLLVRRGWTPDERVAAEWSSFGWRWEPSSAPVEWACRHCGTRGPVSEVTRVAVIFELDGSPIEEEQQRMVYVELVGGCSRERLVMVDGQFEMLPPGRECPGRRPDMTITLAIFTVSVEKFEAYRVPAV